MPRRKKALQSFHRYQQLPAEIRREIWEWSFGRRRIPLKCEVERAYDYAPPPFTYNVPFQARFAAFPLAQLPEIQPVPRPKNRRVCRVSKPDVHGFFSAFVVVDQDFPTLPAMMVCRESREWARLHGYISMEMQNLDRQTRSIIWNPKHDIIDFNELWRGQEVGEMPLPVLSIFAKQFPFETTEVRYLALSTQQWPIAGHNARQFAWPLIDYISLREVAVVVDHNFEVARVVNFDKEVTISHSPVWTLPDNLEENIDDIRKHYEKWGPERNPLPKKPTVRVAMSAAGILNGEDRHINLRCKPCPALGI